MKNLNPLEKLALKITELVGTTTSIVIHTIVFGAIFALPLFGVGVNIMLLVLTTALSVEAIYLAIFIQMTVNRSAKSLKEVEQGIDEIEEDIDEIQEDVEDIQEDVEEIQEDVEEIQEDEDEEQEAKNERILKKMQETLQDLANQIENFKKTP